MPRVVVEGDLATCVHAVEDGSPNVLVNNRGVAMVGVSTVGGGPIIGPGISTVLCAGSFVSVDGDGVTSHGEPPHSAATITATSNVFAG